MMMMKVPECIHILQNLYRNNICILILIVQKKTACSHLVKVAMNSLCVGCWYFCNSGPHCLTLMKGSDMVDLDEMAVDVVNQVVDNKNWL